MRACFTTQPGTGMFRPLVPFARALADAGHEVAFAPSPSFRPQGEACGLLERLVATGAPVLAAR